MKVKIDIWNYKTKQSFETIVDVKAGNLNQTIEKLCKENDLLFDVTALVYFDLKATKNADIVFNIENGKPYGDPVIPAIEDAFERGDIARFFKHGASKSDAVKNILIYSMPIKSLQRFSRFPYMNYEVIFDTDPQLYLIESPNAKHSFQLACNYSGENFKIKMYRDYYVLMNGSTIVYNDSANEDMYDEDSAYAFAAQYIMENYFNNGYYVRSSVCKFIRQTIIKTSDLSGEFLKCLSMTDVDITNPNNEEMVATFTFKF